MEQKDMYTLRELYNDLDIPLTELGRQAGISDVTLAKIRDGASARRSTINSLLRTFSQIYGVRLSTENVKDIIIKDKLAKREQAEKAHAILHEQPIIPSLQNLPIPAIPKTEKPQNRNVESKRAYAPRKSNLPDGCIPAIEFANTHGVSREAMRWHMNNGLGAGLIHGPDVPEDGTVQVRDWIHYEERNKRVRKDGTVEMERYLTSEQQRQALEFWKRHDVGFEVCNRIDCWCHTVKGE